MKTINGTTILEGEVCTVRDPFGNEMQVANIVSDHITFYPHRDTVELSKAELLSLIERLTSPNELYYAKAKDPEEDYMKDELAKRLAAINA